MKGLSLVAIVAGAVFLFLGIFARNPGQIAISNTAIVSGTLIIIFVAVMWAILFFKERNESGSDK